MHEEMCTHLRGAIWAQSTNQPPWIQIFSTQPCICRIFSVGISVNNRRFSRARCMQSTETVIYPENLKFCTPTHPFSLPSAEAPTRGSEPENQPTNPSCVYNPRPITYSWRHRRRAVHPPPRVLPCDLRSLARQSKGSHAWERPIQYAIQPPPRRASRWRPWPAG